jgi:hypothetical protein
MFVKIDTDHARFKQIIRGKIKQELKKFITSGELIGREGQGSRQHPSPSNRNPAFGA